MLRIVGSLIACVLFANSAAAGLIFTAPQITGVPGESGTLFLGINSDMGPESLSYDLTGFAFTGTDLDVVVTPTTTSGAIIAPGLGDAPLMLAIGTYSILGSASDGDTTSFRIGMKFEPLGLFGSKYDSEGDPPVEGFVTASNSVVPEPTSLAIFCCLGLCPLYYRRR